MSVKKYGNYQQQRRFRSPGASAGFASVLASASSKTYGKPYSCIDDPDTDYVYYSWTNIKDGQGWKATRKNKNDLTEASSVIIDTSADPRPTALPAFLLLSF
jgi:hypothetical protein